MKKCIICRKEKANFNKEHVIPAILHGGFVVNNVCSDCNKILGDKIDTPFSKHRLILFYRAHYKLNRANRKIKNPFDQEYKDSSGKPYFVRLTNDGFKSERKPDVEYIGREGIIGKVSLSSSLFHSEEQVKKIFKSYAKEKLGKEIKELDDAYSKVEYSSNPELKVIVNECNDAIIFEIIKIAYEATVTYIEGYFEDEYAKMYSRMLFEGKIFDVNSDVYGYSLDINKIILEKIKAQKELWNSPIFISIMNVDEIGMVCSVRIFDYFHSIIMSKRTNYFDERIIILLNDIKKSKAYPGFIKKTSRFEFMILTESFSIQHKMEFRDKMNDEQFFKDSSGKVPLFNSSGKQVYSHVEDLKYSLLTNKVSAHPFFLSKGEFINYKIKPKPLYLKSNYSGLLYELIEVTFYF